jgi:hypothetical protein
VVAHERDANPKTVGPTVGAVRERRTVEANRYVARLERLSVPMYGRIQVPGPGLHHLERHGIERPEHTRNTGLQYACLLSGDLREAVSQILRVITVD